MKRLPVHSLGSNGSDAGIFKLNPSEMLRLTRATITRDAHSSNVAKLSKITFQLLFVESVRQTRQQNNSRFGDFLGSRFFELFFSLLSFLSLFPQWYNVCLLLVRLRRNEFNLFDFF